MSDIANQIALGNLQLGSQIVKGLANTDTGTENLNNIIQNITANNNSRNIYAKKGDSKYNEKMDTDKDSIITFNEYIKYLSQQNLNKYSTPANSAKFVKISDNSTLQSGTVRVTDVGKAMRTYLDNYLSGNNTVSLISRKA